MAIMHNECVCRYIVLFACVESERKKKSYRLISRGKQREVVARFVAVTVWVRPWSQDVLVVCTSIKKRQSMSESSHCMWCLMVLALAAFSMFVCALAVTEKKAHSHLAGCCCTVLTYLFAKCTHVAHIVATFASLIATVTTRNPYGFPL